MSLSSVNDTCWFATSAFGEVFLCRRKAVAGWAGTFPEQGLPPPASANTHRPALVLLLLFSWLPTEPPKAAPLGCAAGSVPVRAQPPPSPALPEAFSAGRAEAPVLEQGFHKKLRSAEAGAVGMVWLREDFCVCARPSSCTCPLSRDRLCHLVKAALPHVPRAGRNRHRCR